MSENPQQPSSGAREQQGAPRLEPRPLNRPAVDESAAGVFGRPQGVEGAFDPRQDASASDGSPRPSQAPPPSLAEAFSPSEEDQGVVLQRPPWQHDSAADQGNGAPLWAPSSDPWRNPGAGAALGGPALTAEETPVGEPPRRPGTALSLTEVLFGNRLRMRSLAILGALVLAVGALGGGIGWFLAQSGNELNREVELTQVGPGKEREPGSIAETVRNVAPAVVSIEVTSGRSGGVGSGVVIESDGYIVTNDHVVSSAKDDKKAKITAVFTDGTRADAKVVGSDPKTDLAVIKVNVRNPTVIQLGKSADLAPGDTVIAVGSPFGLDNTVTVGIVSALNRPVTAPGENDESPVTYDAIQTDAAINPGNSGGALVDRNGLLVGINSLIRTIGNDRGEGGSIGLGFAIPVDEAVRISQELIKNGKVVHPALGVRAASVAANTSEGAQVRSVDPGGPADRKGIEEKDVIVKVGDRMVRNSAELTVAVRQHKVGDVVQVKFVRDGRELVAEIKLGAETEGGSG